MDRICVEHAFPRARGGIRRLGLRARCVQDQGRAFGGWRCHGSHRRARQSLRRHQRDARRRGKRAAHGARDAVRRLCVSGGLRRLPILLSGGVRHRRAARGFDNGPSLRPDDRARLHGARTIHRLRARGMAWRNARNGGRGARGPAAACAHAGMASPRPGHDAHSMLPRAERLPLRGALPRHASRVPAPQGGRHARDRAGVQRKQTRVEHPRPLPHVEGVGRDVRGRQGVPDGSAGGFARHSASRRHDALRLER